MFIGTLLYCIFAFTPALDAEARFFEPVFDAILPLAMFCILFVTFCKVDFRRLRPCHWHLWVSVFQVLIILLLTGTIIVYKMQGNALILMESLLACVIGPCAAAAPVITQKLGGNLEEMTTYTFLSNIITVVFIPICFPLIEKSADISFVDAALLILYKVLTILVLPMLLAYIVKHHWHSMHKKIISVKDLSYYLWGLSLTIVTGTTVKNIVHADTTLVFLCVIAVMSLVLCIIQFAVGRFIGHYFDRTVCSGQALGQKNTAFAIWITYSYLTPLSSIGPGCYILWQNIINSVEIWMERRKGRIFSS